MVEAILVETQGYKDKEKKGVGRPISTTTKITALIKARIAERLYAKIDPVIDAMIETASGRTKLTTLVTDEKGNERITVQDTIPNSAAARLLLEHTVGKPKDTIEHKGAIGIVAMIKSLEGKQSPDG